MNRTAIRSCFVFTLALLGLANAAHARPLTLAEKLSDLDQLVAIMRSGYGPLRYKAQLLGLDLDRLRSEFSVRVASTRTNGEFYYEIGRFVARFQDSHFAALLPTTHVASVPFTTDLVGGKVLIDAVNRAQLPEPAFPYRRGDEVIAINGAPVAQTLDRLQEYLGSGYAATARRSAAMALTVRAARRLPAPRGPVTFTLASRDGLARGDVTLEWRHTGVPLDEFDGVPNRRVPGRDFDALSVASSWSDFEGDRTERSFRCSGDTRVAIPADATVILRAPFVAYYHPTPKGNVGYLRIPHYSPANETTGAEEYELRFRQYEYAVSVLEANTVGLVIDQDHNCGGSVDWLHRMVSLFMPTQFAPMQFTLLANAKEFLDFQSWAHEVSATTIEGQNFQRTLDLIERHWRAGDFMTPKTSIGGELAWHPNPVRYSKPIVMLIDELSGSGGDAFPALMQGYGRARLFGTRTMGAGGHVTEQAPLNYSQIRLNMTKSLFFRPDGVAVENNGAVPDVGYAITADDFADGYLGYQRAYLAELLAQIR